MFRRGPVTPADAFGGGAIPTRIWSTRGRGVRCVAAGVDRSLRASRGARWSETDWPRHGSLAAAFDSLVAGGMPEMLVVMPDGDDGWYTTWNWLGDWTACRRSPPRQDEPASRYCVPWPHYDDYIARDLVSYIDRHYRTRAERAHRDTSSNSGV